jgi:uncharacterized protein (TIGR02594 family)
MIKSAYLRACLSSAVFLSSAFIFFESTDAASARPLHRASYHERHSHEVYSHSRHHFARRPSDPMSANAMLTPSPFGAPVMPQYQQSQYQPFQPSMVAQAAVAASPRLSRRAARRAQQAAASTAQPAASFGGAGSSLVSAARQYIGGNPTGRRSLWCGAFMNLVLERTGRRGTGSDMARSFASYGQRISGPQVGAIAVMARSGGGHVGVVSGIDASGNPIIISGNHGHRVAEATYPRGRIYAYVMPTS